jgi:hypothetical protein
MGFFERLFKKAELEGIDDIDIVIDDYYHNRGMKYCSICNYAIPVKNDRYLLYLFKDKNGVLHKEDMSGMEPFTYNICFRCTKNSSQLKRIVYELIEESKITNKEENHMSIIQVLEGEAKKLESQLSELNTIKLPENIPTHIVEHLKMKKSLIDNCLKSIEELKNNYQLDETIKKLFTI